MLMYVYTRCSPIPGRINACLCMYIQYVVLSLAGLMHAYVCMFLKTAIQKDGQINIHTYLQIEIKTVKYTNIFERGR